jgi:hypothetical protein
VGFTTGSREEVPGKKQNVTRDDDDDNNNNNTSIMRIIKLIWFSYVFCVFYLNMQACSV